MSALTTAAIQIRQLSEQRKTGSLLIVVGGKTACLNFTAGNVSYIFFKSAKDQAAIDALRGELFAAPDATMQIRFVEGAGSETTGPAVPADTVLRWLADPTAPGNATTILPPVSTVATSSPSDRDRDGKKGILLTDANKAKLENLAVEMMGPMGKVACTSAFASTVSLREAINAIAVDLSDPEMEKRFIEEIRHLF